MHPSCVSVYHLKMRPVFLVALACLVISSSALAQTSSENASPKLIVPAEIMRQVVQGILQRQFRPSNRPRRVYLWENGVESDWLPEIRNVEFVLLNDNGVAGREHGLFFFQEPAYQNGAHTINFGYGDPSCGATGDTWDFTMKGGITVVRPTARGWGTGCGNGSGPVKIRGLKVGDVSPNELKGYKFFRFGKLKDIRLGISTRDDIKQTFGDTCEGVCNYDADWSVWINYYGLGTVGSQTLSDAGRAQKTEYFPKPEFYGKVRFVRLIPKHDISFGKIKFPRQFAQSETHNIGDSFDVTGRFKGAVHSAIITYTDGYGLEYSIFNRITFHNIPIVKRLRRGDLTGIEYSVPDEFKTEIFSSRTVGPEAP